MSVTAMSRTFWTKFPELSYLDKKGSKVNIKNSTAKIVLLAIADNADDFGENSYQSFETLATKSSINRRSVIRVVRALISTDFLTVAGVSTYGTNNYTINLEKLGEPPKKRAKKGRPKTSDSESLEQKSSDPGVKTSDSVTKNSDPTSPEPSFNPPLSTPHKKGDLIDGFLDLSQSPGIKRVARIDSILSYLGGKLHINTETKRWKDFAKFVDERQQTHHEPLDVFVSWLTGQKNFDVQFWPPSKMQEMWPQAFLLESQPNVPQINVAALETTKQIVEEKFSGEFTPRPDHIPAPVLIKQKLAEAAQQRRIRK
jgi:hypothetical protein